MRAVVCTSWMVFLTLLTSSKGVEICNCPGHEAQISALRDDRPIPGCKTRNIALLECECTKNDCGNANETCPDFMVLSQIDCEKTCTMNFELNIGMCEECNPGHFGHGAHPTASSTLPGFYYCTAPSCTISPATGNSLQDTFTIQCDHLENQTVSLFESGSSSLRFLSELAPRGQPTRLWIGKLPPGSLSLSVKFEDLTTETEFPLRVEVTPPSSFQALETSFDNLVGTPLEEMLELSSITLASKIQYYQNDDFGTIQTKILTFMEADVAQKDDGELRSGAMTIARVLANSMQIDSTASSTKALQLTERLIGVFSPETETINEVVVTELANGLSVFLKDAPCIPGDNTFNEATDTFKSLQTANLQSKRNGLTTQLNSGAITGISSTKKVDNEIKIQDNSIADAQFTVPAEALGPNAGVNVARISGRSHAASCSDVLSTKEDLGITSAKPVTITMVSDVFMIEVVDLGSGGEVRVASLSNPVSFTVKVSESTTAPTPSPPASDGNGKALAASFRARHQCKTIDKVTNKCSWYDESTTPPTWSTDGCSEKHNGTSDEIVCTCNHLTEFAIMRATSRGDPVCGPSVFDAKLHLPFSVFLVMFAVIFLLSAYRTFKVYRESGFQSILMLWLNAVVAMFAFLRFGTSTAYLLYGPLHVLATYQIVVILNFTPQLLNCWLLTLLCGGWVAIYNAGEGKHIPTQHNPFGAIRKHMFVGNFVVDVSVLAICISAISMSDVEAAENLSWAGGIFVAMIALGLSFVIFFASLMLSKRLQENFPSKHAKRIQFGGAFLSAIFFIQSGLLFFSCNANELFIEYVNSFQFMQFLLEVFMMGGVVLLIGRKKRRGSTKSKHKTRSQAGSTQVSKSKTRMRMKHQHTKKIKIGTKIVPVNTSPTLTFSKPLSPINTSLLFQSESEPNEPEPEPNEPEPEPKEPDPEEPKSESTIVSAISTNRVQKHYLRRNQDRNVPLTHKKIEIDPGNMYYDPVYHCRRKAPPEPK